ncbi:putative lipoprotein [Thioalkalivibrio sp. K90mix]|uniref:outer membrane protein assembly factor BamC n=1 Tax=Thioalkalivibrio sp. (strain K90mix) TaxID=396595 RepID=UPI000195AAEA|nr:outer membrane protein assembly factor BamC [Thioalkalivibrio sp. K90mix]ADC70924.1 putative lipoprotein [Thioalkalivibrio sp. K90mix]
MKLPFKPYHSATRATLAIATGLAVAGCGGWGGDRQSGPEYEMSRQMEDLEVPPDLIAPDTERAYRLPDDPGGRISARDMQQDTAQRQQQPAQAQPGAPTRTVQVLPESAEVQLMRDGGTRWLQVDGDPGEIWDRLVAFWDSQNLRLERNEPQVGVMQTEWAEDRAGIPLRGTQNIFARALGNVYDANTRDQYRMRVERVNGQSEIYITHRGAEEQAEGQSWRWAMRPSDPELEAEMLNRLLVYLTTGDPGEGGARVAETLVDRPTELQMTEQDGSPALLLGGEYERVWRQLGTFLDRAGLLVDEQDRQAGIYEVTYRPDMTGDRDEPGFFGRIFGRGGDRRENERYQIRLEDRGDGDLLIEARDIEGDRLSNRDAEFVLERIQTQMQR